MTTPIRTRLTVFFALCLFALTLCISSSQTTAYAQSYGGILNAGMQTDPIGLDPHKTDATSSRNMLENTYDTLVGFDSAGNIVPWLAESWTVSDDNLTWTFNLRSDVTFHDGSPFTAEDVVFSIDRIRDPAVASPRASDFSLVDTISAPDDTTVIITLKKPFSPLLASLAASGNAIVSKAVAMANDNDLNTVVVGTGPFKFTNYVPQVRLELTRFDDYWGEDAEGRQLPYLDGITFTFYPEPSARTTALRTGTVDWIEYVPAADVELLKSQTDITVVGGLSANFRAIYLNTQRPPFDNPKVRQAISYAIDKTQVVELALFGTGGVVATGSTIPSNNTYAVTNSPYNTPDLDKAKALLAEAGYADGFNFDLLVTSTYDFLRDPAEIIQANLAPLGINTNIIAEDWSIFLPKAMESDFQAMILGESGQADPDKFLYEEFHSESNNNMSLLQDAELDSLLEQGRTIADPEDRKVIYNQAQARLFELAPYVMLFHSAQYEALRDNVAGYEHYFNTSYRGLRATWLR